MSKKDRRRIARTSHRVSRKILASAMSVVLVVGLLPVAASAASEEDVDGDAVFAAAAINDVPVDDAEVSAADVVAEAAADDVIEAAGDDAADVVAGESDDVVVAAPSGSGTDDAGEPAADAAGKPAEKLTIDSVMITGVAAPAVGAAATTQGIATSTTGAIIASAEWLCKGDDGSLAPFSGTFESGKSYEIRMTVATIEGYALAVGATASVNGAGATFNVDSVSSGTAIYQFAQLPDNSKGEGAPVLARAKKQDESGTLKAQEDAGSLNPDLGTVLIPFIKKWTGVASEDTPESIRVTLYKYLKNKADQLIPVAIATVTKANDWKYDFDISNEPLYEGTEYSEDTAYQFKVVEDPIEGYVETDHRDPEVVFTPPTVGGDWTRYEPCNELEINTSVEARSIVVGKKGGQYVVWSAEPLSESERRIAYNSALTIKGMSGAKYNNFAFFSGWGSSSEFGMTVSDGLISFKKKSDWSLFGTGTYNKSSATANESSITNTRIQPVSIVLGASKTLEAAEGLTKPDVSGKYDLTIAAVTEGAPLPATPSVKNPDGDGGSVSFGEITFTKAGTYSYTVSESGTVPGVSNGQSSYGVTVTVTDNHDGTLSADVTSGSAVTNFTNTYRVGEVSIELSAAKKLEVGSGDNPPDVSGKYDLTITAKTTGAPMPNTKTFKNVDANGTAKSFGEITYSEPGDYVYTITEEGTVAGVENGTDSYDVTVTVTDQGEGKLSAAVTSGSATTTFTNTYHVDPIKASFPVKKVLEVPDGLDGPGSIANAYTFTLSAEDGAPLPAATELKNPDAEGGVVTFGDITFDDPGTYAYSVTESGSVKGVANDPQASKHVEVKVVDNGDGTMTATASSTEESPLTFTNTYSVKPVTIEIPVEKVLSVPEGAIAPDITGKFTFKLDCIDGAPMPGERSLTNPDKDGGTVTFGPITYDAPHTYGYTVTESGKVLGVANDPKAVKTFMVVIADNSDGTLTAEVNEGEPIEFTNTYNVGGLTVSKKLAGNDAETDKAFTFVVTLSDMSIGGTYGDMTFANGVATIGLKDGESAHATSLPEGVTYTVEEADYSGDGYKVIMTGDTGIIAKDVTALASFTNTRDTFGDLAVSKEIAGKGADAKKAFDFTVTLSDKTITGTYGDMEFADGVATLRLKGGEQATATGLPNGVSYTVTEADYSKEGYTVAKEGDAGTIAGGKTSKASFTNTKQAMPAKDKKPAKRSILAKTGDDGTMFIWALVIGAAMACVALVAWSRRRFRGRRAK